MDNRKAKIVKWLEGQAEKWASKPVMGITDPVKRDHRIAWNNLIASLLYMLAGDQWRAKRHLEMWSYLRKRKD